MSSGTFQHRLPRTSGSGDALLIRELIGAPDTDGDARRHTWLIVCARSADPARLQAELRYLAPALRIAHLPDWETLPYDRLSPHQDLVSTRLATLHALTTRQVDVVLVAATTASYRIAPVSYLAGRTFSFRQGQRLDERALREQLVLAGYDHVSQVVRPGEYAIRGGLIDLFPMGSTLPYRLDLFDDEVESIRSFDPDTQRSLLPVPEVQLLPGREFPFDDEARTAFRNRWRERIEGDPSKANVYRDVGNGIATPGIDYYLPLFFGQTATLFDHVPADSRVLLHGDVDGALRDFRRDVDERFRFLGRDPQWPGLPPAELFVPADDFFVAARAFEPYRLGTDAAAERADGTAAHAAGTAPDAAGAAPADADAAAPRPGGARAAHPRHSEPAPAVAINRRMSDPLALLRAVLDGPGPLSQVRERRIVLAESAGRRETLLELLREHELALPLVDDWQQFEAATEPVMLGIGPLHEGFRRSDGTLLVLTENELFPGYVRRAGKASASATQVDALIRDLSELKPGDAVVHAQHGIGRYQGLVSMDLGEGETEFLHLTYAAQATLYVPVAQLHLIGRYTGASQDDAPLHALGSGQWEKARRKAAEKARDTAAELLDLYARRSLRAGHAFPFDAAEYGAFVEGFGFEETPDQLAAIHAVVQDLVSPKPMDRLVCGDVGFGKTEVALRAAFVAAASGRQVAVLTPTTLLAEQHHQLFVDRFANWPIRIAELSRFRSAKESRTAIAGLADGTVDIVVGTHKLLSKDVKFRNLGLVIIDEEHRFGVRQKDALKALRAEVDVLTLTATPIPRTLAMSLEGIRDFSVIATAPQKRLSIKTFVRDEGDGTIREAMLRELKRGGQVYFLHNEIDTIEQRRQRLAELVPEATIRIGHGQMAERELESVMRDFHQQRFNVLLCTTIIETGIDVPSANTIIIHRADRFGLAQLHQLRGRVGRSHHQAYAYLLIPNEQAITKDAAKRLDAIQSLEDLGSGFYLSMHDLEIRGAGEVLGDDQSGEMQQVGFAMYSDMLQRAVRSLKSGEVPDLLATGASDTAEVNLHAPALLPEEYCGDVHERLMVYKRLGACRDDDELLLLREELVDRFGRLPPPAQTLLDGHRLRLMADRIGIAKIDATTETVTLQFRARPNIDPAEILLFAQRRRDAQFAGQDRLRIRQGGETPADRARIVRDLLLTLMPRLRPDPAEAPAAAPLPTARKAKAT